MLKPGDTHHAQFVTADPATGAATDADSLPVATVTRNDADDGAVPVTVTNMSPGRYRTTFVVPLTYTLGDTLHLSVAATVGGVAAKAVLDRFRLASPGDVLDEALSDHTVAGTAGAALGRIGSACITVVSPVSEGGTITLYQGDTYTDTRVLSFTITGYVGPDLDGENGTFRMLSRSKHLAAETESDLEVACAYNQTGTTVTVDVTLAAGDTAGLDSSPPKDSLNYLYQLRAEPTGKLITVAEGDATVRKVLV